MYNLSKAAAVVGGLVILVALGLIGYVVAPYFVDDSAADRTAFLDKVSEQINVDLPSQVDESTRLESTTVNGDMLQFHYTLMPPLSDTLDADNFMARYGDGIQQIICEKGRLRRMLQNDFRVAYQYRLADGSELGTIKVERADCGV
ncbi:hypothetical protein [uncultured Salinisphaera sp.]|uniref:hypothetical protein n=1 Tax=uncultured Salinisphaera sp. TaxID=359372 RepID=UPI0032B1A9C9|tara:strand:- start:5 stop:442 length:438 start_codon:yes stop_codon:yes gene_type:complete